MQFLTTMKLPFSVYSNRALTIVSRETGEKKQLLWTIRRFCVGVMHTMMHLRVEIARTFCFIQI
jgi:hypothetical protein